MASKIIRQHITVNSNPDEIYDVFLDSKKHTSFTGSKAKMSKRIGGTFTVFDGYASGRNLELISNEYIRQSWRASNWPENCVSEISLELEKTHLGTRITFIHKNIPDKFYDSIKDGWKNYYWTPLKLYFKK
ncbi:hypothetical protein LBMAG25_10580 [Bacteroidota bacterium]|nr:hypothetical protein LBMAG25_10580 [Bacteroidota bacterium]